DQSVIERGGQAAQVGILRQRLDQRLGFRELLGKPGHLFGRQEQEAILLEEGSSPRLQQGAEKVVLRRQLLDQGRRRLSHQFRRRSIDDRQDSLFFPRE